LPFVGAATHPRRFVGAQAVKEPVVRLCCHIGLAVTDLERSKRFYCDLLGFEHDRDLEQPSSVVTSFLKLDPPADLMAVYLTLGEFQLELLHYSSAGADKARQRQMNETGLTHISLVVLDVAATVAAAADYGGTVFSEMGDLAAIIRDPDGQLVEIVAPAYWEHVLAERAARKLAAK
jgi:catechol 2,3-dioxygenase-like lactoylglutathione lyase family enzyme